MIVNSFVPVRTFSYMIGTRPMMSDFTASDLQDGISLATLRV